MKKLFLILSLMLLVASSAFAQKNPIEVLWLIEDSSGTNVWNIGVTADQDTSDAFSVARLPETGLGFQVYWNAADADTGQLVLIMLQSILNVDYGAFASFSDSADAIDRIATWTYADSLSFGGVGAANNTTTASGRGSISWNPTLVGPATQVKIVAIRRSGTTARGLAIAAIKEY